MNTIYFKENLKYIRNSYGLTQKEMAEKLNLPEKRYQAYENGRIEPNMAQISHFCCTLNLDADNLIRNNMELSFTSKELLRLAVKGNNTLQNVSLQTPNIGAV